MGEPYGARFREADATSDASEVLGDDGSPEREVPRWLTRTSAVLAVAALAFFVLRMGADDEDVPRSAPTQTAPTQRSGSAVIIDRNTPPPPAPLELAAATSEQWPTRGYSYVLDLSNPTDTEYVVLEIGFPVQGAEMAWDRTLVIGSEQVTRLTVDFLVNNCAAVLGRPAPEALRLTLKPAGAEPGEAGTVSVMDLDLSEPSAALDAAGGVICNADRPVVLGAS